MLWPRHVFGEDGDDWVVWVGKKNREEWEGEKDKREREMREWEEREREELERERKAWEKRAREVKECEKMTEKGWNKEKGEQKVREEWAKRETGIREA
jgi:hypothetical protein